MLSFLTQLENIQRARLSTFKKLCAVVWWPERPRGKSSSAVMVLKDHPLCSYPAGQRPESGVARTSYQMSALPLQDYVKLQTLDECGISSWHLETHHK